VLIYPYTTGLGYVQAAQLQSGWEGVNELFRRMPVSTEQILHPEKYAANEAPIPVTLPADLATELGSGWIGIRAWHAEIVPLVRSRYDSHQDC
jgi:hypothetical protein